MHLANSSLEKKNAIKKAPTANVCPKANLHFNLVMQSGIHSDSLIHTIHYTTHSLPHDFEKA